MHKDHMKTRLSLLLHLIIVSSFLCTSAAAQQNPWDIKLPFKEATVEYSITGSETGTETLYIKDYGKERAKRRTSTSKMMFMTTATDQLEITNPDWIYTIDMKAGSGTKVTNPVKYILAEYDRLSAGEKTMVNKNAQEIGASALGGMQGSVQQNAANILGYDCDLVSMGGTNVYSIHGTDITLKSEMKTMGMNFSTVATSIKQGAVADSMFAPPAGVPVTHDQEADEAAKAMAKSTMDTLKSPDASRKMKEQAGSAMQQGAPAGDQQGVPAEQMDQETAQEMQKAMDAVKGLFGK